MLTFIKDSCREADGKASAKRVDALFIFLLIIILALGEHSLIWMISFKKAPISVDDATKLFGSNHYLIAVFAGIAAGLLGVAAWAAVQNVKNSIIPDSEPAPTTTVTQKVEVTPQS